MKKRVVSILLALSMVLAMLPGTAQAAESGSCGENVTWAFEDGVLTISGIGDMEDYDSAWHLSETSKAPPWARNPDGSYQDRPLEISSVIVSEGVTHIGMSAFYSLQMMTAISLPGTLTSIGAGAFTRSGIESVDIPDTVTSIDMSGFSLCRNLKEITIPGGITTIKRDTFWYCYNLERVTILDGLTTIETYAFGACESLSSISIPASVEKIESDAFYGCESLTDIYYAGSEAQWRQIDIEKTLVEPDEYIAGSEDYVDPIIAATIHYNSTGPNSTSIPTSEYIYDTIAPGSDLILPAERLEGVTDTAAAVQATADLTNVMTTEQKTSPTGIDLATLYAETAAAKASSQAVDGGEILVNAASLSVLESAASQAVSAVETALAAGGVITDRELFHTAVFTTDASAVTVRIDPSALTTSVDRVRVETPNYALTFSMADLAPDLTQVLTFSASDMSAARVGGKNVGVVMPDGGTSSSITVSLPSDSGDTTYQAVVDSDGNASASKYNPATTKIDGKVNKSGTYTVQTNTKDFTDISSKSAEMQSAIRYLASKDIIQGVTATTFSPDSSISRAEIATLLLRALGKLDESAATTFSDVDKNRDWFYSAAGSSQRYGLINGYEDNTFRGTNSILKEQIVAVASRVLKGEMGYKTPSDVSPYLSKYSDAVSTWAQPEVALATRENLVVYRTDGTFSGAKSMTRGDAAIIIYRLFQKIW